MGLMDLFSLEGKVAVITGGERMYGKSSSTALVEAGAKLYMACPFLDAAEETAEELRGLGGQVETLLYLQDDPESIRGLVSKVIEKEGRIDVFINAARVIPKGKAGWFQEEEGLDWAVKVNSTGMLYVTSLVGKEMISRKSGSIINFASMMGMIGIEKHNYDGEPALAESAYSHDYALNKSGIIAWTRHAASYYGRYGVRINCVCPGGLQSDRTPPLFSENYAKHTQLGRLANNDDIKGAIAFLASDASAYVTGLSIPIDGGYTCI